MHYMSHDTSLACVCSKRELVHICNEQLQIEISCCFARRWSLDKVKDDTHAVYTIMWLFIHNIYRLDFWDMEIGCE